MKIIAIVGADLSKNDSGQTVVGSETKNVCDRAIDIHRHNGDRSLIVCCCGIVPNGHGHDKVWMAKVVHDYVVAKNHKIKMITEMASEFRTWGEMEELAKFVHKMEVQQPQSVVLVVRDFHAPRAHAICRHIFQKKKIPKLIRLEVETVKSNTTWYERVFREKCMAVPSNWMRMQLGKLV